MLKPYPHEIREIACVFTHTGVKADQGNRVYAVAVEILAPDGPRRVYASHVRYPYLTARERYHSNLSREALEGAPEAEEVRAALLSFLAAVPVVLTFPQQEAQVDLHAWCGNRRRVDLSFAAEYFLPHVDTHSPRRLWEYLFHLKRDRISFTAEERVELSVKLTEHLCGVVLNDETHPRAAALRYYLDHTKTLFGRVLLHLTRNFRNYFGALFHPCNVPDAGEWKKFLAPSRPKTPRPAEDLPGKAIDPESLVPIYQGLSETAKGFTFRDSQVTYARHVARALNDGAILTIEAGTGTGKTQGYLIPVLEFLARNPQARVAVSTYTKSLQDQIFRQEITFLKEHHKCYRNISVALLKGKSNYLCAEKLDNLYDDTWQGRMLLAWLYLVNLTFHFREADGRQIGARVRQYLDDGAFFYQLLRETSARSGCNERHVLCPAQVVTAEARAARLVVTNHHKLALLNQDPVLCGLFRMVIIDEANHFEQAVRSACGLEVNSRDAAGALDYLDQTLPKILMRAAADVERDIMDAQAAAADLREEILGLGRALKVLKDHDRPTGGVHELPAGDPAFAAGHVRTHLSALGTAIQRIEASLAWVKEGDLCRMLKIQARTRERLKNARNDLAEQRETLKTIAASLAARNRVQAYDVYLKHWSLISRDVEVAEQIRENVYRETRSLVYTSATLSREGNFDAFKRIAGLDHPLYNDETQTSAREFRFVTLPSPFALEAAEIIVHPEAGGGSLHKKAAWLTTVTRLLPDLIRKNRGRTLVLFASYHDLETVAERIGEEIQAAGFPLLLQQSGFPTDDLCDEFRAVKESVLFGVDTFWYGVDFKGDTLTQVIITRIPYPSPADPLQAARKRTLDPQDYRERYIYDTAIKMTQGIGRLIRSETDRGRVIILDSRYRSFIASPPTFKIPAEEMPDG